MAWQLRKSRGLFFDRTGERQQSYWANDAIISVVRSQGREVPHELLNWDPSAAGSKSNCPLLHEMLTEIVALTDARWRARADNIYAGRTFSNDDMALAKHHLRGGMVAISNEFSSAAIAYSAMYGIFLHSLEDSKVRSPEAAATIQQKMRSEFDQIIDRFRVAGVLGLKDTWLLTLLDERHFSALDGLCRATEKWALAHELGHHLARDMSARRDKGVERLLNDLTHRSSIRQKIGSMPVSQRREVEADLLATLILAGRFKVDSHNGLAVAAALAGATVALTTVAHMREEWSTKKEDSHPGCLDRLLLLMTFTCELYGNQLVYPEDSSRSHMTIGRHAAMLMTFASWMEDLEKLKGVAGEIRAITSRSDLTDPMLVIPHYATVFGMLAENYKRVEPGSLDLPVSDSSWPLDLRNISSTLPPQ